MNKSKKNKKEKESKEWECRKRNNEVSESITINSKTSYTSV